MVNKMQTARLIPVAGIGSDSEAEQRATSPLLAVVSSVRPLSKALLDDFGAPKSGKQLSSRLSKLPSNPALGRKYGPMG